MFEVDSPPDQTHHCGWTTDCRFAARRTTASARRATGLAQPSLAARPATALDDGRTCPTGRPRQPQRTLAHCVPRRVPTLAQDTKSQPKPGSVNQPAGWTATSTARPAEVWKGARDALDCEEQQQRGAGRKRQPHWTEEVATATLMAPLHSSSSRSDRAFLGIGSPARITATEPPWADPPQPAISSPVPETIRQEQDSPRSSGGRSNFASHVAVRWFRRLNI